jgi:hypothetical protein
MACFHIGSRLTLLLPARMVAKIVFHIRLILHLNYMKKMAYEETLIVERHDQSNKKTTSILEKTSKQERIPTYCGALIQIIYLASHYNVLQLQIDVVNDMHFIRHE